MQDIGSQPSLFPDLDYHRPDAPGFFALLTACDDPPESPHAVVDIDGNDVPNEPPERRRNLRQECFPNAAIETVLRGLHLDRTTYIGQAEHFERNRRAVTVARVGLSFVDVDTYSADIAHLGEREVVELIRSRCDEERIPDPSLIVASGRGYYAKWLYDRHIPRAALPRWNAVQERLVGALRDVGADPQARDVSRVLRVVGTTNEKTGNRVRVVWSNDVDGEPARYGFDTLVDETLDRLRASHHLRKDEHDGAPVVRTDKQRQALLSTTFTQQSLWWARLEDFRTIAALRGFRDGAPVGQRNLFLFLAATALGWCVNPNVLYREIQSLGREFAPTLTRSEWYAYTSTTFNRVKASWAEGGAEQRYRYTTARLIELLGITPDEMRRLSTLIDATEDRRRKRERDEKARRAAGAVPREVFLAPALDRREEARKLAAEGRLQREIAAALGINQGTVSRYLLAQAGAAKSEYAGPRPCILAEPAVPGSFSKQTRITSRSVD